MWQLSLTLAVAALEPEAVMETDAVAARLLLTLALWEGEAETLAVCAEARKGGQISW